MTRALDKLDRQLIALLQANARATTTALAERLGVARTTVQERMSRLEETGTITGYSAILSRNPFNEYTQAIISLALVNRQLREVVEQLRLLPEIKVCESINGEFDLICRVEVPRVEDLDALLDEISSIPGIERQKSWVILSTRFDKQSNASLETSTTKATAIDISRGEGG